MASSISGTTASNGLTVRLDDPNVEPNVSLIASPSAEDGNVGGSKTSFWEEAGSQISFAAPMAVMSIIQSLTNTVSVMFVGHLGTLELSSAAVSSTFCTITGHSIMMGMAIALETFCGQAYGAGGRQLLMVGRHTQRSLVVLLVLCVPISFLWWHLAALMKLLHQDPAISANAQHFARWLIPSLFASAITQPLVKFFQAQSVIIPMAIFETIALVIHIPMTYVLVFTLNLGFTGAALAASITWWVNAVLLVLYVKLGPFTATWPRFSWRVFEWVGIWRYLSLAGSSMLMYCLEFWVFEVTVIFAGLLPNPQLQTAIFSIAYNMLNLAYMIPLSLSAANSTRVANELGSGNPGAAKFAARVSFVIVFIHASIVSCLFLATRHLVGYLFINDSMVVEAAAHQMVLVAALTWLDAHGGICAGAIRGTGRQELGALVYLGAYYVIGLPLGILSGFYWGLGLSGFWIGLICSVTVVVLVLGFQIIFAMDWELEAKNAHKRITEGEEATRSYVVLPSSDELGGS